MSNVKIEAFIQKCAVIYIAAWTISPPLSLDMIWRYLALACAGVWFVIAIMRNMQIHREHAFALLFAVLVSAVAFYEKGSFSGVIGQISIFMLVIAYFMLYFYKDRRDELSGLVPIVLILFAVWNFITSAQLIIDPNIARDIVRNDPSTYSYIRKGVGGYGLMYPQVCVFPAVVMWALQSLRKNRIMFAVGCVWGVSYFMFVTTSGYSIALMASLLGLYALFLYRRRSVVPVIIISALIIALFLVLLVNWDAFRNALLDFFDGTKVAKKINDLVSTAETGETADSIAARWRRYYESLETIYYFPVIGGLFWRSGGGHSALLDAMAKYGIFGFVVYIKMMFCVPLSYKRSTNKNLLIRISNGVIISLLFVTLLNSVPYNFIMTVTIVLAAIYADIIKWRGFEYEPIEML